MKKMKKIYLAISLLACVFLMHGLSKTSAVSSVTVSENLDSAVEQQPVEQKNLNISTEQLNDNDENKVINDILNNPQYAEKLQTAREKLNFNGADQSNEENSNTDQEQKSNNLDVEEERLVSEIVNSKEYEKIFKQHPEYVEKLKKLIKNVIEPLKGEVDIKYDFLKNAANCELTQDRLNIITCLPDTNVYYFNIIFELPSEILNKFKGLNVSESLLKNYVNDSLKIKAINKNSHKEIESNLNYDNGDGWTGFKFEMNGVELIDGDYDFKVYSGDTELGVFENIKLCAADYDV